MLLHDSPKAKGEVNILEPTICCSALGSSTCRSCPDQGKVDGSQSTARYKWRGRWVWYYQTMKNNKWATSFLVSSNPKTSALDLIQPADWNLGMGIYPWIKNKNDTDPCDICNERTCLFQSEYRIRTCAGSLLYFVARWDTEGWLNFCPWTSGAQAYFYSNVVAWFLAGSNRTYFDSDFIFSTERNNFGPSVEWMQVDLARVVS